MHKNTFRRIQFDVVGENIVESSDGVLSITLYATYVPREYLGCSSMMRWLAIFWYDENRKIEKMLLSSPTSLTQWREQLNCDWEADKQQIKYQLESLMNGMYRDSDVETMVNQYYEINAEFYLNDGSGENEGGTLIIGRDSIVSWYKQWNGLGVDDVMNEIDELDISGNKVVVRMVTMASHGSGKCSQSFMWYGVYRFNGKAKIVQEQRFYQQKQLETAKLILKNCGDLSPLPKQDL